ADTDRVPAARAGRTEGPPDRLHRCGTAVARTRSADSGTVAGRHEVAVAVAAEPAGLRRCGRGDRVRGIRGTSRRRTDHADLVVEQETHRVFLSGHDRFR